MIRRVLWVALGFLTLIGCAIVIRRVVAIAPSLLHGYQPPPPPSNPIAARFGNLDDKIDHYPWLVLIHILPGLLFILLVPFQLSAGFRSRHLKVHRIIGRIVLICGLIVGTTALVMSFAMPAIGGVNQAAATILFGTLFLFALGKAYVHIRRREIALHREWMIRAFAIGLAVTTIRPIVGIFFATSRLSGLTPREFFGTAFWIGFTIHLIVAESWIRTHPQSTQSQQQSAQMTVRAAAVGRGQTAP
ncbi:MAG: DUF2306 domain-containing protein [Acidobacteria bacterium]|nr:DUF2306 domain-containing protein [Acidobacteriota bacterium]